MTQLVFITDIHLANRPPVNRLDDYNKSLLKKIKYTVKYCQENKVKHLLIGGDLWQSYKPDPELLIKFIDIIADSGLKLLFIYGNHDIQGNNTNFVDKTAFGMLQRYPWFYRLDEDPYEFKDCIVAGLDYSSAGECSMSQDYNWGATDKKKILLCHPMIVNEPTMLIHGEVRQVNVDEIMTNADLLLCGHYHLGFKKVVKNTVLNHDFMVVNPGAIARRSNLEATKGYGPRLAHIKVKGGKIRVELVKIPCKPAKAIFNPKPALAKKQAKVDKDAFVTTLRELAGEKTMGANFIEQIKEVVKNPPAELQLSKGAKKILMDKMDEHG